MLPYGSQQGVGTLQQRFTCKATNALSWFRSQPVLLGLTTVEPKNLSGSKGYVAGERDAENGGHRGRKADAGRSVCAQQRFHSSCL